MNRQRARRSARQIPESLVLGSLLALSCLLATPLARALHARFPEWNKTEILLGALAFVFVAIVVVLRWLLTRFDRNQMLFKTGRTPFQATSSPR